MKNLLYILLFVPLAGFGQEITADLFTAPANTGTAMTVGINASKFNQFEGGQIGAFSDLDGNGTLECVGLETISTGFFGLALWGDDASTPEADGLASGAAPSFAILHNGNVILVAEIPQFTGYVTNSIVNITDAGLSGGAGCTYASACNGMFLYSDVDYSDDGSCTFPEAGYDCDGVCISDADADGVCDEFEVAGCTDGSACNFDGAATDDDGSCTYPDAGYDCDGVCLNDADLDGVCDEFEVVGCQDDAYDNYDASATDAGNCEGLLGCTDGCFYEFDAAAEVDNGSCFMDISYYECSDEEACNYNNSYCSYASNCNYPNSGYNCDGGLIHPLDSLNFMVINFLDSEEYLTNSNFQQGDVLHVLTPIAYLENDFLNYTAPSSVASFSPAVTYSIVNGWESVSSVVTIGLDYYGPDYISYGYNSYTSIYHIGENQPLNNNELVLYGRSNDSIQNGFIQGRDILWVIERDGVVYNAKVNFTSNHNYTAYYEGLQLVVSSIDVLEPFHDGCTDPNFMEFEPLASNDDGSCSTFISIGCMDANFVNYAGADVDADAIHDNANNFGDVFGENYTVDLNSGATSPSGAAAIFHDQSYCQTQIEGCTDAMAINYDPHATQNDATDCDWSLNGMQEYNVDQDGNILAIDYEFGAVDADNVNDGIVGSDFDNANVLFWEGYLDVEAHVIDNLADVMEWIDNNFQQISVDLAMGWNMIGYSCIHPISAEVALEAIVDELQVLKDNNGAIYIPEYGFNGIGDLTPGHGYQLKVTDYILDFNICE